MAKKYSFILGWLLIAAQAIWAQGSYSWQSAVTGISGSGFYTIPLSPAITSLCMQDYEDLRLVDSTGYYVAYLVRKESAEATYRLFEEWPIVTKSEGKYYNVCINNPKAQSLSELWVTLYSTGISNTVAMSGSDDQQHWFEISRDRVLYPTVSADADTFEQKLTFPPVTYRYLRLSMKKGKDLPVHIVRAGVYHDSVPPMRYDDIPTPAIIQRDSSEATYITLAYGAAYEVDRIQFVIEGPKYFRRGALLYNRVHGVWVQVREFVLSSNGMNVLNPGLRSDSLMVMVSNGDDAPLHIKAAKSAMRHTYLITYLDADRSYYLVFGNAKATKPHYDLAYFEDSIRKHALIEAKSGLITKNAIIPNGAEARPRIIGGTMNKYWIWAVLFSVAGLLLFFTIRMGREVGKI